MTLSLLDLAEEIADVCRRLHARGLLAGAEGNVSVRLADGSLLVTPSATDKATLQGRDILHRAADGALRRVTSSAADAGGPDRHDGVPRPTRGDAARDSAPRASSELEMHLRCYAARSDVGAVVHAHPPAATAFATAGRSLPTDVLPELPVVVGPAALVPYGRPGTPALGDALAPFLPDHDLFLLANHGVTSVGRTLSEALLRLESAEQAARILLGASLLGGAQPLDPDEAAALVAIGVAARRKGAGAENG